MARTQAISPIVAEMREFAQFAPAEQRYIRRSLDIGLERQNAFRLWARDAAEERAIRRQYLAYSDLRIVRGMVVNLHSAEGFETFVGKMASIAACDLVQERIASFAAFRFLYERLLGARIRPWLPSTFCAAAALPQIRPERRKILLRSMSEAAATAPAWSEAEPAFYPTYIEFAAA